MFKVSWAFALLVCGTAASTSFGQQSPAPILAKTLDNAATGDLRDWDFGGTDLTIKAARDEVWMVDGHAQPVPFINIFSLKNLGAAPRRIPLNLPGAVNGAPVLGIAEIPSGEFTGDNLILLDPSFGTQAPPQPTFGIFDDQGNQVVGTDLFTPQNILQGSILSSIDVNPEREEIVAYDIANHAFYVLDFQFAAAGQPVPLLGFPNFFASSWFLGNDLVGAGNGICYNGPDRVLAPAAFLNAFETHLVLEYDLTRGGIYSGKAIDLSLAGAQGFNPDLAFVGIESGTVDGEDALLAMNFGDDTIYAFGLLLQDHSGPTSPLNCDVLASGQYNVQWAVDPAFPVTAVHIFENGVQVAAVDPALGDYTSPLPILGSALIEVGTEVAGVVSGVRQFCLLESSVTPRLPGVQFAGLRTTSLGTLAGVEVTRNPARPEDFRGFLLGLNSNTLTVFDHTLAVVETLQPNPPVLTNGSNQAAVGVTTLKRGGRDLLAILDPDGPRNTNAPSASLYSLEEDVTRGQRVAQIDPIDLQALDSIPTLRDWDADESNQIVAGGILATGELVLVQLRYDESNDTIAATQMAPFPFTGLTPLTEEDSVGVGVSILPSGNLLVAGGDAFSNTYTEALLLTPFQTDPAQSARLVGYAQGIQPSGLFFSGIGPGVGPNRLFGLDTAFFAGEPGVGVSYLPTGEIVAIGNPSVNVTLTVGGQILIHAENECSNPNLQALQLQEETVDIPSGGQTVTPVRTPAFPGQVGSRDYFYYLFNESDTLTLRLKVEATLGNQVLPDATEEVVIPGGRYFRRGLLGRAESSIQLKVQNPGAGTARVRILIGAMGIGSGGEPRFKRGDCDANGIIEIADPIFSIAYQFLAGPESTCMDGCDLDDDGQISVTDTVNLLGYMFQSGPRPQPPGPDVCGPDVAADDFKTCNYSPAGCQ